MSAGILCLHGNKYYFSDQQIFPGLILSDIKPAKRMKFKTVCYLLVQLMHCRKMFKAEIPFSNVMTCEDDDKVIHEGSLGIGSRAAQADLLWEHMGWPDQPIEEFLVFLLELELSNTHSLLTVKTKLNYNRPQIWSSSWTSTGGLCGFY